MTLKQKLKAIRDRIHLRRRADIREAVEIAESLLPYKELSKDFQGENVKLRSKIDRLFSTLELSKECEARSSTEADAWKKLVCRARERLSACLRYNEELQEENALLRCCREIQAPCYLRVNGKLKIYDVR